MDPRSIEQITDTQQLASDSIIAMEMEQANYSFFDLRVLEYRAMRGVFMQICFDRMFFGTDIERKKYLGLAAKDIEHEYGDKQAFLDMPVPGGGLRRQSVTSTQLVKLIDIMKREICRDFR